MDLSWDEVVFNVFSKIGGKFSGNHIIKGKSTDEIKLRTILNECKVDVEFIGDEIKTYIKEESSIIDGARIKIEAFGSLIKHLNEKISQREDYIIDFIEFTHPNVELFLEELKNEGFSFSGGKIFFNVDVSKINPFDSTSHSDGEYTTIYKKIKAFFAGPTGEETTYFYYKKNDSRLESFVKTLRKEYTVTSSWFHYCYYITKL